MPHKIFICYRRVDKELARGIESQLAQEFGTDAVFLDIETIHGGQKWKNSILKALTDKPIVVTLITRKWNSRRGGQPKLMDKDDYVRFELETALKKNLAIVPVLYDGASLSKKRRMPSSLHPLHEFQTIPFSSARYKYDMGKLVDALSALLDENSKEDSAKTTVAVSKPLSPNLLQTSNFTRSMFTLSPAERKAFAERAKQEEERLARVRSESTAFYARTTFWIAVIVTFALSVGSVFGAEVLAQSIGSEFDLPNAPLIAGILLASIWSVLWIALGASAYSYDPELGSKVFYTRGILGGWVLGFEDFEPIGYWAAFPISTAVLWLVVRGLAMLALYFLHWDYLMVFWIVIGAYSLPVLVYYSLMTVEEVL